MQNRKMNGLQFFAESAAAETETGTGVISTADAGQNGRPTLEELGVPAEKAESYREFKGIRNEETPAGGETPHPAPAGPPSAQGMADAHPQGEGLSGGPKGEGLGGPQGEGVKDNVLKFTWDDVMARDDMKAEISRMMSQRVNRISRNLQPLMETLASHYGIAAGEDGKLDFRAIAEKAVNDPYLYDRQAKETGVQDDETAKRIAMLEAQARRREQQADELIRNISYERHIGQLREQALAMKQRYPEFDLGKELENPAFRYYISPQALENGHGMTIEQAYMALHGNEVLKNAVKDTAGNVAEAYASAAAENRSFPEEHSGARQGAGLPAKKFSEMTDEEFERAKRNLIRNYGLR